MDAEIGKKERYRAGIHLQRQAATRRTLLDQTVIESVPHQLSIIRQTEFLKEACPIRADGLHAESHLIGDLRDRLPPSDFAQDQVLAI